jgi:hypothetical protein
MIPVLDTTLLTNAQGEPTLWSQLRSEIESADSIDVVMALIRRSGGSLRCSRRDWPPSRLPLVREPTHLYWNRREMCPVGEAAVPFHMTGRAGGHPRGYGTRAKLGLFLCRIRCRP